jgi:hypothetical protein
LTAKRQWNYADKRFVSKSRSARVLFQSNIVSIGGKEDFVAGFHYLRDFRYRLRADTAAISTHNGKLRRLTIPANSSITVIEGPFEGAHLVDIVWEGKTLMMFTADLKVHGELVDRKKIGANIEP